MAGDTRGMDKLKDNEFRTKDVKPRTLYNRLYKRKQRLGMTKKLLLDDYSDLKDIWQDEHKQEQWGISLVLKMEEFMS